MGLLSKLASIFSKKQDSEVSILSGAVDDSLSKVVSTMTDMEVQSVITSSTGEWLDSWGQRFNVYRNTNEVDSLYRTRILGQVLNAKGTVPALIDAVKRALGDDTVVTVEETYNDLRMFNISTFSGTGKYQDSDTVRLGVVKIIINKAPNTQLAEEIFKSRAAGINIIIEQSS
jgi:hypothetical protein